MPTEDKSALIRTWLTLINKKPNNNCRFFFLAENEKAIIIDLEKMPTLLMRFNDLDKCEKSYLFVDMDYPRNVRYYGFDIDRKTFGFCNEVGPIEFPFAEAEDAIYTFLEDNAAELSKWHKPYTELLASEIGSTTTAITTTNIMGPTPMTGFGANRSGIHHNTPYGIYHQNQSSTYKDREAFVDKVYLLVKNGRTSLAIDFIADYLKDRSEEKDLVNDIYRSILIDKLDILTARQLLLSTKEKRDDFLGRSIFADKFKELIARYSKPKGLAYADI